MPNIEIQKTLNNNTKVWENINEECGNHLCINTLRYVTLIALADDDAIKPAAKIELINDSSEQLLNSKKKILQQMF